MTNNISLLCIVTAFALANQSAGQMVMPHSKPRMANEIDHKKAVAVAQAAVVKLGLPAQDWSQSRAMLWDPSWGRSGERVWHITSPRYSVMVGSETARLMSLFNRGRLDDQYRGRGRTGKQFFASDAQAKSHLLKIAGQLGIPSTAVMSGFSSKRDGQVRDGNSSGYVGCVFKDSKGKPIATIAVDPQDGVPTQITLRS